ncbi:tocopherol cyclase family protein [Turicibacter sp. TJ11]|uniref:tocopherol cyclase family protein n=1 Tax=Turicibacter sp. TJ11 TaxID=2806443 RepID=UPI001F1EA015|nr:tocopherol cyclase family protein [Turicibacter sp. TJ11]
MKINPDLYHGHDQYTNFFEGWYFKIVDATATYALALIPGIARSEDAKEHHSFIQVVNLVNHTYNYYRFNVNDFYSNNHHLKLNIGINEFSFNKIVVNLEDLNGVLYLGTPKKWPDSKLNPGSMGFYNYLPFMECYSQVCAIDGEIEEGHLKIGEQVIDFSNGKYYIEKNWGKSFPTSWIWIQSNSFADHRATVTCSLGIVPFPILKEFRGFLIGVTVDDKFYSFTTMNRSKINIQVCDRDIILCATHQHLQLILKTKTKPEDFVECFGPQNGKMSPLLEETLKGEVEMTLMDVKKNILIYHGIGKACGIEYGGDISRLLDENK